MHPGPPDSPDEELFHLHERVLRWYDHARRDLPWRAESASAWGILVSEIMLQQTPVERVEPVWRAWMRRWPTPATLAQEPVGEAVRAWGRLGYPRRALRLHAAAVLIRDQHDGRVPDTLAALRALPGVGEYTAAATGAFAFGLRSPVVDTNVRRVQARVLSGQQYPAAALTRAEYRLAEAVLPQEPSRARRWNVAIMELGALVCTARSPRCQSCPLVQECAWWQAGRPPHTGPARRTQAWAGTDRQVRGRLLQVLRDSPDPVDTAQLRTAWDQDQQRERCLDGLIADGLVEPLARGRYRLPR